MPTTLYTIADAVAAGRFSRAALDRVLAAHPELGLRTVGGTVLLRESDLRRAEKLRGKPGQPRKVKPA